jgi:hypothetical protein
MKFKSIILVLSIFAASSSNCNKLESLKSVAKKAKYKIVSNNRLSSAIAGSAAAGATYALFPSKMLNNKFVDNKYVVNPAYVNLFNGSLELIQAKQVAKACAIFMPIQHDSPAKFILSAAGQNIKNIIAASRIGASLIVGYLTYNKVNQYLETNKNQ